MHVDTPAVQAAGGAGREARATWVGRPRLIQVAVFRGIGQARWGSSEAGERVAAAYEQTQRPASSRRLGTGTLACRHCDAPVAVGVDPLLLTDQLICPFCDHRAPARDFLSLASPTRPARVVVRVGLPGR
jgi:hypothetical protein